jgi:cytochrome c peroxidase
MFFRAALIIPLIGVAVFGGEPPTIPADQLPANLPLDSAPLGLDPPPSASDNALTAERVALGRRLFFDPILSLDKSIACASCHRPDHGYASVESRPKGVDAKQGIRRAPTLLNRAYAKSLFWDGRAGSLEEQALEPIANPLEMASSVTEAVKRLNSDSSYNSKFAAAFDDGVTEPNLAKALASFERTLLRGDSPVDRFRLRGEHHSMTPDERHGFWLYESKGQCWRCHSGPNFTDERFHNTGVSWGGPLEDLGRFRFTKKDDDRGKFKTPTLRGVGLRPPYMHDGSLKSLEDVVEFYNRGGGPNPHMSPFLRPLGLTKDDVNALVAFLKSL